MKNIFEYTDYRSYLKDYIGQRKQEGTRLSNRWFAQKIGINSSSWLTSLLKGQKGLSKQTANKLSEILHHTKKETSYFENLVYFNQARTGEERARYFKELSMLRKAKRTRYLSDDQYEYYATWYHSVIRALVAFGSFRGDFAALSRRVQPTISEAQTRKSVELLERLELVRRNSDGSYAVTSQALEAGDFHQHRHSIHSYQQETMKLGWESIDRYTKELRDISTLTLGISSESFEKMKTEIVALREKLSALANDDTNADRVYQFNMQLFPVSAQGGAGKGARS
ncbi:MAG: TIGR02147 family protein [Chitinivibrionales bacterium]|nr:TIGR02147 family protein [Chitinivibrionales bacterium]